MKKRYLFLTFIAIALGLGILFMPAKDNSKQVKPELLLAAIDDPSRFLSSDDITDRLVKKDPALLLIDVRPAEQFKAFSIPGSINIPVDSLLTPTTMGMLYQNGMDKVFYSNSDVTSDQAWILCKRIGMQRIYVLQGGVNNWFASVVKAPKPLATGSEKDIELYQFRLAACQYFYGNPDIAAAPNTAPEKKKITIIRKAPAASSGGGC
jgi:3-mercaptopyruvate sulfurtransferase SseA